MSDVPTVELVEQLRRANAGLRDVLTARDTESVELRAENVELRAMVHALGLQVAELQRRLGSRSYDTVIAALRTFTGHLIVDGYGAYQRLRTGVDAVLAGIQQCVQHVLRRCRAVAKLGPGTLQSHWTGEVTDALTTAHTAVQDAKSDHQNALDPELLAELRERYDTAVDSGIIHNRHRDWHDGNHPGYTLARRLATHADQVWHFTTHLNVDWTSNAAEGPQLNLWTAHDGAPLWTATVPPGTDPATVTFDPRGRLVTAGSALTFWDPYTGTPSPAPVVADRSGWQVLGLTPVRAGSLDRYLRQADSTGRDPSP